MSESSSSAPWWPSGYMAQMVVITGEHTPDGQNGMGVRKLIITGATAQGTGWRVQAQDSHGCSVELTVDTDGTGQDCEPWDDEYEEAFGALDPENWTLLLTNETPDDPTRYAGVRTAQLHAAPEQTIDDEGNPA